ncbi:hypothetical protein PPROV_001058800 [Pycnococcus provasolii]|uniref:Uncharacterized protein n=1 Tax=Pycnococcus provasolii TaxID=41880 RepID=A0A830I272_9CHLO|nr:hypothetical protein PPROV_001058800 [Pycnococcus provasolii]
MALKPEKLNLGSRYKTLDIAENGMALETTSLYLQFGDLRIIQGWGAQEATSVPCALPIQVQSGAVSETNCCQASVIRPIVDSGAVRSSHLALRYCAIAPPHYFSTTRKAGAGLLESEAETRVFHARVINAWGDDADEDLRGKLFVQFV